MRIESQNMFKVFLPYEGAEIMIPVSAVDEQNAKVKLRGLFLQWANELVADAAMLSPIQRRATPMPESAGPATPMGIPTEALSLRIEELVKECMPIKKPVGAKSLDKLVKEFTGFPYETPNYQAIISELEKIKASK